MDEVNLKMGNISVWGSFKQNMYLANDAMLIMNDMMTNMAGSFDV